MSNEKLIESINNIIKSILIEENINNQKGNYSNKYKQLENKYVFGETQSDKTIDPQKFDEIFSSDPTFNKSYIELKPYILSTNDVKIKYESDMRKSENYMKKILGIDTGKITRKKDNVIDIDAYSSKIAGNLDIIHEIESYNLQLTNDAINMRIINSFPISEQDFPIYVEYMIKYYLKEGITDIDKIQNVFHELFSLVVNEHKIDNLNLTLGFAHEYNFNDLILLINELKSIKNSVEDISVKSNSIVKQNGMSDELANQLKNIDPTNFNKLLYFDSIIKWYYELQKDVNYKYHSDKIKLEIKTQVDDFNKQAIELDVSDEDIQTILKHAKTFNKFKSDTLQIMKLQKIKNSKYDKEYNENDISNTNNKQKYHKLKSAFDLFNAYQWNILWQYTNTSIQKKLHEIEVYSNVENTRTKQPIERISQDICEFAKTEENPGKIFCLKPGGEYFGFLYNLELYSHSHKINARQIENDQSMNSLYGIAKMLLEYQKNVKIPNNEYQFLYALEYQKLVINEKHKIKIQYNDINDENNHVLIVLLTDGLLNKLTSDKTVHNLTIKQFLDIYGNNKDIQRNISDMYHSIRQFEVITGNPNEDKNAEKKSFREFNKANDVNYVRWLVGLEPSIVPIIDTDYVERKTGDAGYEEQ